MGISNTFGTLPGFIAPIVLGRLTPCGVCDDQSSHAYDTHWRGPKPCPPGVEKLANGTFVNVPDGYSYCTSSEVDHEWQIVFLIAGIIAAAAGTFFFFFSSGKVQSWNTPAEAEDQQPGLSRGHIQSDA
jgi:hypothetical protein